MYETYGLLCYRRPILWRNQKKELFKPDPMTERKRKIIQGLLQEYDIQSAADIQEDLKDFLGGT
jgi:putative transposase